MDFTDFIATCDECLRQMDSPQIQKLVWVYLSDGQDRGSRIWVRNQLDALVDAALEFSEPLPIAESEIRGASAENLQRSHGLPNFARLVKRLRGWALKLSQSKLVPARQPSNEKPQMSLDARAVAVFFEHCDWTKKQIAEHLGCHEKSLAPKRCPNLHKAMAIWKAADRRSIRGSKNAEGDLEAWVD